MQCIRQFAAGVFPVPLCLGGGALVGPDATCRRPQSNIDRDALLLFFSRSGRNC
jgi:hypothetical protein